jgi:LPS export ABC transporter protein LptC
MTNKIWTSLYHHLLLSIFLCALFSCSFDYGESKTIENKLPDIVMEDVVYTRVRSGDHIARLKAQHISRYEELRIMELKEMSFEQFGSNGTVNASGNASSTQFMMDTSDVKMSDGVKIEVESEDMIIETNNLEWKDSPKTLSSGKDNETNIYSSDGTKFSGMGFYADARKRTWNFSGDVQGLFIDDDDDMKESSGRQENKSKTTEEEKIQ